MGGGGWERGGREGGRGEGGRGGGEVSECVRGKRMWVYEGVGAKLFCYYDPKIVSGL